MPVSKRITRFRLWNTEAWIHEKIISFTIQGSLAGGQENSNWTDLGQFNDITYTTITPAEKSSNEFYQIDFDSDGKQSEDIYVFQGECTNPGFYNHYKLCITEITAGGSFASATEWILLEEWFD
jgi:hypothetical protein